MRFLFCLGTILLAFHATASTHNYQQQNKLNPLFQFIAQHPALRQYAFYSLIANRCTRYMPFEIQDCNASVAKQIKILDLEIIFLQDKTIPISPYVFIAFKQNLITLLKERQISEYLVRLDHKLNLYGKNKLLKFNLWSFTQEYYPDPYDAAKVIAALFQDTSEVKLHLAYLEKVKIKAGVVFDHNRQLLSKVISDLNMVSDYSAEEFPKLFYPEQLPTIYTRGIYHFYVPLYLAMELRRRGIEKEFAQAAPLMMTLTYEFITKASDYRYIFRDPHYLSPKEDEGKLQDIHASYVSSHWGAGSHRRPLEFSLIKELFYGPVENAVFDLLYL